MVVCVSPRVRCKRFDSMRKTVRYGVRSLQDIPLYITLLFVISFCMESFVRYTLVFMYGCIVDRIERF